MNKDPSAGGSPAADRAVTVQQITDLTDLRDGLEFLDQDGVQLDVNPLDARRVILRLGQSVVIYHSTNRRARSRTKIHPGFLAFTVLGPQAGGTLNGLPLRPDLLLVAAPGAEAEIVVDAGYESVAFLIPPETLFQHLQARGRGDEFRAPDAAELRQPGTLGARPMFDLGKRLIDTAAAQPAWFDDCEQVRDAAHIEFIEMLTATLGSNETQTSTRQDRTRQSYSRVVQMATEYALVTVGERLYVTDLCKAANVSERTLQYAFREIMQLTPIVYLTRLRLHRVRDQLRAARDPSIKISSVALDWGFWHFGEFSRAYKQCFGETPSVTLKLGLTNTD